MLSRIIIGAILGTILGVLLVVVLSALCAYFILMPAMMKGPPAVVSMGIGEYLILGGLIGCFAGSLYGWKIGRLRRRT